MAQTLRLSFFGGGTDYPAHYRAHGGRVLATTIRVDRELPIGLGLGGSSARVVEMIRRENPRWSAMAVAMKAIELDESMGVVGGHQDQIVLAHGGFCYVDFQTGGKPIKVNPHPIGYFLRCYQDRIAELERHLMLFIIGQRNGKAVAASYAPPLAVLERVNELVGDALHVLLSHRNIREFGELLHEGWLLKRQFSPLVTTPEIDAAYARARSAGAIGGKLCGAGGGGCLLVFAEPGRQAAVAEAVGLETLAFRFSGHFCRWYHVLATIPA